MLDLLAGTGRAPDKTAFVFRDSTMSFDRLRRRMLSVAAGLLERGVRPGDRIALRLPNGPDYVATWLAVQRLGAIVVQLPPIYRRREIERIIADSGASLLVSADAVRSFDVDPQRGTVDDAAVITYIATAEGPLTGVVSTHSDISAACDAYARGVLNLRSDDVVIGALGLGWAYGLGALLTFPLQVGATAVVLDSQDSLLSSIADTAATVLFAVPTTYRMLLRHPAFDAASLGSLRCCVSAGEPLPADVIEEWRSRTGHDIVDGLGTTEMTHIFISARPGHVRPGLIGEAVGGYEARIVDDDGRGVPDGTAGLLAVRGPTRARYWRDPEAERRTTRDGWTLTGDVCARDADGWFQHLRRADSLIVSAGYKISRREVEDALRAHAEVAAARVTSMPDAMRGAVAHAVVTAARGADATTLAERLRTYLKTELAPFKCPRVICVE